MTAWHAVRLRFKDGGGTIMEREVKNLGELTGFDIVANCTGLGAKRLLNDPRLVPLRGQVYKVRGHAQCARRRGRRCSHWGGAASGVRWKAIRKDIN